MDFRGMKRKQLQALCKKRGLPANGTNMKMAESLSAFIKGDGATQDEGPSCSESSEGVESENSKKTSKKVSFFLEGNQVHELVDLGSDVDDAEPPRKAMGRPRASKERPEAARVSVKQGVRTRRQSFLGGLVALAPVIRSPIVQKKMHDKGTSDCGEIEGGREKDIPPLQCDSDFAVSRLATRSLRGREITLRENAELEKSGKLEYKIDKKRKSLATEKNDSEKVREVVGAVNNSSRTRLQKQWNQNEARGEIYGKNVEGLKTEALRRSTRNVLKAQAVADDQLKKQDDAKVGRSKHWKKVLGEEHSGSGSKITEETEGSLQVEEGLRRSTRNALKTDVAMVSIWNREDGIKAGSSQNRKKVLGQKSCASKCDVSENSEGNLHVEEATVQPTYELPKRSKRNASKFDISGPVTRIHSTSEQKRKDKSKKRSKRHEFEHSKTVSGENHVIGKHSPLRRSRRSAYTCHENIGKIEQFKESNDLISRGKTLGERLDRLIEGKDGHEEIGSLEKKAVDERREGMILAREVVGCMSSVHPLSIEPALVEDDSENINNDTEETYVESCKEKGIYLDIQHSANNERTIEQFRLLEKTNEQLGTGNYGLTEINLTSVEHSNDWDVHIATTVRDEAHNAADTVSIRNDQRITFESVGFDLSAHRRKEGEETEDVLRCISFLSPCDVRKEENPIVRNSLNSAEVNFCKLEEVLRDKDLYCFQNNHLSFSTDKIEDIRAHVSEVVPMKPNMVWDVRSATEQKQLDCESNFTWLEVQGEKQVTRTADEIVALETERHVKELANIRETGINYEVQNVDNKKANNSCKLEICGCGENSGSETEGGDFLIAKYEKTQSNTGRPQIGEGGTAEEPEECLDALVPFKASQTDCCGQVVNETNCDDKMTCNADDLAESIGFEMDCEEVTASNNQYLEDGSFLSFEQNIPTCKQPQELCWEDVLVNKDVATHATYSEKVENTGSSFWMNTCSPKGDASAEILEEELALDEEEENETYPGETVKQEKQKVLEQQNTRPFPPEGVHDDNHQDLKVHESVFHKVEFTMGNEKDCEEEEFAERNLICYFKDSENLIDLVEDFDIVEESKDLNNNQDCKELSDCVSRRSKFSPSQLLVQAHTNLVYMEEKEAKCEKVGTEISSSNDVSIACQDLLSVGALIPGDKISTEALSAGSLVSQPKESTLTTICNQEEPLEVDIMRPVFDGLEVDKGNLKSEVIVDECDLKNELKDDNDDKHHYEEEFFLDEILAEGINRSEEGCNELFKGTNDKQNADDVPNQNSASIATDLVSTEQIKDNCEKVQREIGFIGKVKISSHDILSVNSLIPGDEISTEELNAGSFVSQSKENTLAIICNQEEPLKVEIFGPVCDSDEVNKGNLRSEVTVYESNLQNKLVEDKDDERLPQGEIPLDEKLIESINTFEEDCSEVSRGSNSHQNSKAESVLPSTTYSVPTQSPARVATDLVIMEEQEVNCEKVGKEIGITDKVKVSSQDILSVDSLIPGDEVSSEVLSAGSVVSQLKENTVILICNQEKPLKVEIISPVCDCPEVDSGYLRSELTVDEGDFKNELQEDKDDKHQFQGEFHLDDNLTEDISTFEEDCNGVFRRSSDHQNAEFMVPSSFHALPNEKSTSVATDLVSTEEIVANCEMVGKEIGITDKVEVDSQDILSVNYLIHGDNIITEALSEDFAVFQPKENTLSIICNQKELLKVEVMSPVCDGPEVGKENLRSEVSECDFKNELEEDMNNEHQIQGEFHLYEKLTAGINTFEEDRQEVSKGLNDHQNAKFMEPSTVHTLSNQNLASIDLQNMRVFSSQEVVLEDDQGASNDSDSENAVLQEECLSEKNSGKTVNILGKGNFTFENIAPDSAGDSERVFNWEEECNESSFPKDFRASGTMNIKSSSTEQSHHELAGEGTSTYKDRTGEEIANDEEILGQVAQELNNTVEEISDVFTVTDSLSVNKKLISGISEEKIIGSKRMIDVASLKMDAVYNVNLESSKMELAKEIYQGVLIEDSGKDAVSSESMAQNDCSGNQARLQFIPPLKSFGDPVIDNGDFLLPEHNAAIDSLSNDLSEAIVVENEMADNATAHDEDIFFEDGNQRIPNENGMVATSSDDFADEFSANKMNAKSHEGKNFFLEKKEIANFRTNILSEDLSGVKNFRIEMAADEMAQREEISLLDAYARDRNKNERPGIFPDDFKHESVADNSVAQSHDVKSFSPKKEKVFQGDQEEDFNGLASGCNDKCISSTSEGSSHLSPKEMAFCDQQLEKLSEEGVSLCNDDNAVHCKKIDNAYGNQGQDSVVNKTRPLRSEEERIEKTDCTSSFGGQVCPELISFDRGIQDVEHTTQGGQEVERKVFTDELVRENAAISEQILNFEYEKVNRISSLQNDYKGLFEDDFFMGENTEAQKAGAIGDNPSDGDEENVNEILESEAACTVAKGNKNDITEIRAADNQEADDIWDSFSRLFSVEEDCDCEITMDSNEDYSLEAQLEEVNNLFKNMSVSSVQRAGEARSKVRNKSFNPIKKLKRWFLTAEMKENRYRKQKSEYNCPNDKFATPASTRRALKEIGNQ